MAIPGVRTLIRDRFYSVSRQDTPAGPRIVAIAKRSTASGTGGISDLDVVRASNEADVITAFGEGSHAHRAFLELIIGGAGRIYIVPLPSDTKWDTDPTDPAAAGAVTSVSYGGSVFDAAFIAAESCIPDIIVPWGRGGHPDEWAATPSSSQYGFTADNSLTVTNNWAYKISEKVKDISENINPCIAVMGIKPFNGTSETMTPGNVNTHLGVSSLPNRDTSDLLKETGPYVVVVAAEIKPVNYVSGTDNFGYANGAAHLAATMSILPSYSSIVNKAVYNIESVRYSPTRTQQTALSAKGVNTVVINFNKIPVFGDGLTFAWSTSDYTRLSTKRIVNDATAVVRQACQRFVGEPSNIQTRNSMETAITSGLRGMQIVGALLGSDFTVSYIPNENKAVVDLILTPAFELKEIEVRVAISL
jgi:hypothetical protein